MTFKTPLIVESVDARTWRLVEPLIYQGSKGDTLVVPAGFITDFASVPQFTQAFFPRTGAWTRAAVVHDYLCVLLNEWHNRFSLDPRKRQPWKPLYRPAFGPIDTDGVFRLIMEEAGVGLVKRWLMWTGVRWGALFNPARRLGWLSTAPAVLGISAVTLAAVLGVLAGIAKVVPW